MDIIRALSKEDVRHFKMFLRRSYSDVAETPVNKLFDYIRKKKFENDKEINELKFKDLKPNAFYRLKNRMLVDVQKSLLVLNFDKDDRVLILNYLILSEIFGYKSDYEIAYHYLCRAEKKAVENEFYSILEGIYEQMILISQKYFDLPLLEILKKKKKVTEQKKKIQAVQDLMAELRWRFHKFNLSLQGGDIVTELDNLKNKLEDAYLIDNSPTLKIQVQENIRLMLHQKGDFKSLNAYLSNKLNEFEEEKIFNKNNHNQKIIMLTWLINANIKLLNFQLVYKYANILKKNLHKYKNLYYSNYIWTYFQCVILGSFYSNQLKRCVEVLNAFSKDEVIVEDSMFQTNFNLNSAVVYFCLGDIKKANEYLNVLLDTEFFEQLTDEVQLSVKVVELLFYYENKDFSFIDYAIKHLKQKLKKTLNSEKYKREKEFLKVLSFLSKDPSILNPKTEKLISDFIKNSPPFEVGTYETINYKCWLVAKMEKKDYYKVLISSLQNKKP